MAQDVLYGIRAGNILVRFDTGTLAAVDVGPVTGFASIGGLAFGLDHQLYGVDTTSDVVVRIDRNTGAGTLVGAPARRSRSRPDSATTRRPTASTASPRAASASAACW